MDGEPIVSVKSLAVNYKTRKGFVNAVRDVTFDIHQGENLGLVGESGCGKSTAAYAMIGFLGTNGLVANGDILFKGESILGKSVDEVKKLGKQDILDMLGIDLGPVRLKCALLSLKVLKAGVYGLGEASDDLVE